MLQGKKILLIDDNAVEQKYMKNLLENHFGATVIPARSAEAADNLIESLDPDLIICDIQMEGKDGYQFIKTYKERDDTKSTPVIMISSLTDNYIDDYLSFVGADSFIQKPLDLDNISSTLKAIGDEYNFSRNQER